MPRYIWLSFHLGALSLPIFILQRAGAGAVAVVVVVAIAVFSALGLVCVVKFLLSVSSTTTGDTILLNICTTHRTPTIEGTLSRSA